MDIISEFIDHMRGNDCEPLSEADIIADDKRHLIAMAGYKRSEKKLYYQLSETGGWYRDCRIEHTYNFSPKIKNTMSAEDKAAIRAVRKKQQEDREAFEARRKAKLNKWLGEIYKGLRVAKSHEYLDKKGVQAHGLKLRVKGNELIAPVYGPDGKINSLQRIKSGWKGFVRGSSPRGGYCSLAKKGDDLNVILIAEGFASGATIRECTGIPTIVAFSSGNLSSVGKIIKDKYPSSRIVFCADNDVGKKKSNGTEFNPGLEAAQQAAVAMGGATVIWPEFEENDVDATDFNDAARLYGNDYVKNRINSALNEIPSVKGEELAPDEFPAPPEPDLPLVGGEYYEEQGGDFKMQFRVLGYNNELYYYFPFKKRQIVALSASAHTMNNLFQIDTMDAWWTYFGTMDSPNPSKISLNAANAMMQTATSRGVFKQEDRVRGGGAWMDEERLVLHCGDSLYIDGERRSFDDLKSHYTYVASAKLLSPSEKALDNQESFQLRKICESVTWENPLSGALLAGWLVIAPICAALEYRPHIYLTGESDSGKSTVLHKIIKAVLGNFALRVGGKTSEPSVREQMGYDARPLIFDEAEPSASIGAVIGLARMASTGEIVKKFGQNPFNARFCACFSAINPPINKTADENRISFMVIKKNRKPTAIQDYDDLLAMIKATITPDFGARLVTRTIRNMDSLLQNIEIFQQAFRKTYGSGRASQQIGTMLAGLYLLGRTGVIEESVAIEWVKKYEWTDHTIIDQEGDPIRLVQHLCSSLVRFGSGGADISIAELIGIVHKEKDSNADKILRNYGIAVRDDMVSIASRSQNLARLLKDTEWKEKWSRTLGDVTGAEKVKSEYFGRGIRTSGVRLPVALFLDEEVKDFYDEPVGFEQELEF